MHKPIYIYRSRHNIYYFRWPNQKSNLEAELFIQREEMEQQQRENERIMEEQREAIEKQQDAIEEQRRELNVLSGTQDQYSDY